ncbi:hypothetical protein PR202_ga08192 [Eleusine coracana subsp. coracana]|uniref:Diphosphomevalonate decarboxylase n=1 Tax=Eleusine coracana subsp. coracana TaxID=191504 RepID=A0AAV5C0L7_ELECO|nr:hypothetical protein PR202_ga08192 [Eleusine coracana subsp. coracana]
MAPEGQWVLMATGRSPTNIAVIKYWGKRDEALILPVNDSISVTLDPDHLSATTTVAVSPSFPSDRMWLNGKEISLSGGRFQSCLREIRKRACDFEDEKKEIRIKKEDWEKLHVHIASYNNFPTAAGLASSAAGFACLVFTLGKLMNVKEDYGQLSSIARQGSGSACRSIYGGFVKWCMGKKDDGSDSMAVQLADEAHWNDLVIIIAVVAYTFDAGPNAVLISPNRKTATLLLKKLLYCFPPQDKDLSSYLVGDKSILSDAGLHSIEDVEALPAPPEMKIPDQKFTGDVSYFICSRLGAGPKVVTDESQALIDSVTGLPKGV